MRRLIIDSAVIKTTLQLTRWGQKRGRREWQEVEKEGGEEGERDSMTRRKEAEEAETCRMDRAQERKKEARRAKCLVWRTAVSHARATRDQ